VLSWTVHRLRLAEPFVISRASVEEVTTVFVRVSEDGLHGYGEARPAAYLGESVDGVRDGLRAVAEGGPLGRDLAALHARMDGITPAARLGVDAALHDLLGKRVGRPVYRLLGLRRGRLSTMRTVTLGTPAAMAARARRLPASATVKLKLGGRDGLDADRVAAVRAAVPNVITVDVNGAWDAAEAVEMLPVLRRCGVRQVEQPLAPGDPEAPAVHARYDLPIVLDEECRGAEDLEAAAERGDGVNIKLGKCGGLHPALAMIRRARELGLRVMIGCNLESGLGIAAAAHLTALADDADLDGNLLLAADPWHGPVWSRGRQRPRRAPGLGVRPVSALFRRG
jgi:L-alanine-DL-glutamate epimerase-like enolase superfamily enzyme